jgi:hypothetical protein
VVDDIEVGVLDPHRVVQIERHPQQPPSKRRQQVDPARDEVLHPLERVTARHLVGIEHDHDRHVHVHPRGLEVQEARVEA